MPYIIARDRGFFREEGLEPELIFMKAAQTIPAMLAGGIDFGTATGTAIAAAVSGVDVRVVFAMSDKPSFDLIALPSITDVQQLRGKKLGITAFGALAEILARQILIAHKVPADQVTFLPLGTSDVTYLALKARTIDATMLQIPQTFLAQDEGFQKTRSRRGCLPRRTRRTDNHEGDHFRPARARHQNDPSDAAIVALDPQR